jgi:hypothetical protein
MEVVVTTELGESFPIAGARVALTWVLFFTEDDKMVFLPHHQVAAVVVRRREGAPPGLVAGALVDLQAVLAEQVAQPGAECLEFRAEPVNRNVGLA